MGLEFDSSFIQESDHRPKPTICEASGIPLIDLSSLPTSGADHIPEPPNSLIAEVESACREWGFFQVINHGVPSELLDGIQSAAREFFSLPVGEKRKVRRDEDNPLGYYDAEHTKNVRDWKEIFDFAVNETAYIPTKGEGLIKNQWPEYPPQMRAICIEYQKAMEDLSYRLLELIALTLKLHAKRFNDYFRDSSSFVRINYYPPCPSPDLALGVGHHKDSGALTILAQDDVGGLDVRRKSDGQWVRVKPIPDSYIVNIGDIIQVWSNDKYESTEHRASVTTNKERFSIPFFVNPSHYTVVKSLEEMVNEENPARYDEYSWGDFFKKRKISDFKKLQVENVQVSHFKKEE